jgi:polysaccharide export outer membrane protein
MSKSVLYLLLVSLLFTCIPTQDLIYLQNKNNSDVANTISAVESKPYRLQTNDIISITIKAIDPKLVAMFNPTNEGNMQVKESGLFFDGFTVDDHGAIRIPILGS